uniref:ATP-dependent 6-phosphofructokinase n=1 Tax=candidate division WOR-3 bacterium TaxID=2052148 RepID=A0A7C4XLT3_UNCW3
MRRIGVLTSGGDAPGMNAAIRAIVRTALFNNFEVIGIRHGFQGLLNGDFIPLNHSSVANIIQRGGTILGTARSDEFEKTSGMKKAKEMVVKNKIDVVIVIGGDGTMRGADEFSKGFDVKMIGLPGTIDNDLYGTDFTIGFDTAVNSAMEAVDRIRDTASSLERVFFIEVMGRLAGFITLAVGLAGGAEDIVIPETPTNITEIARTIKENIKKGKRSNIIITAEGDEAGNALKIAQQVKKLTREDYRVAVLGYIQRGGPPTANDRILASKLGYEAIRAIKKNIFNCMIGEIDKKIVYTPFREVYSKKKPIEKRIYEMIKILSG